jgi:hypothetical protein
VEIIPRNYKRPEPEPPKVEEKKPAKKVKKVKKTKKVNSGYGRFSHLT